MENSAAGSINKASDLLLNHDWRIQGEIILRVQHNLLTLPDNGDNIKVVRSHTQALAQCEEFLNRHGYEAVPWYNTAGSAKDLVESPQPHVGVIASALAAEIYGLKILQKNIEDMSYNFTRFLVIGKGEPEQTQHAKTSLVFATPHNPDGLSTCIGNSPIEKSSCSGWSAARAATTPGSMYFIWILRATGGNRTVALPFWVWSIARRLSRCWAATPPRYNPMKIDTRRRQCCKYRYRRHKW